MDLIIVTPYYPPDKGPTPMMYAALAADLARDRCKVTVVAAQPHYTESAYSSRSLWPLISRKKEGEAVVVRVYVPSFKNKSLAGRAAVFFFYNLLAAVYIAFSRKKDAAVVVNPAMGIFFPLVVLKLVKRTPIHYRIHDLYPDIGVRLGVFKNKHIIKVLALAEKVCYKFAKTISVVNTGFVPPITALGIEKEKIAVIPDWADTDAIQPAQKNSRFSVANSYDKKFVIMYGGNVGFSQGLETLISVAEKLKEKKDIAFIFVGEGAMKSELKRIVETRGLLNVQFYPFQPAETLSDVYGAADVGFVSLTPGVSPEWCPAKVYTIMASALPIIAAVDKGGGAETTITQARAGICVRHGDIDSIVGAVESLYQDTQARRVLGQNGRSYVEKYCSRKVCTRKLGDILLRE